MESVEGNAMNFENSPYSVPTVPGFAVTEPRLSPGIGWRILAVVVYLCAAVSLAVGVWAVAVVTWILVYATVSGAELLGLISACTVFLGGATAWAVSGFCFWTGRRSIGLLTFLLGLAFPYIDYAFVGFEALGVVACYHQGDGINDRANVRNQC